MVNPLWAGGAVAPCFTSITDAITGAPDDARIFLGPGEYGLVTTETWPLDLPIGVVMVGTNPDTVKLHVTGANSGLVLPYDAWVGYLTIEGDGTQGNNALVDVQGLAHLESMTVSGAPTAVANHGATLMALGVDADGGVAFALQANAGATVTLQNCEVLDGDVVLTGTGTRRIVNSEVRVGAGRDIRVLDAGTLVVEDTNFRSSVQVSKLLGVDGGSVRMRRVSFTAPSVERGMLVLEAGVQQADLGTDTDPGNNTFTLSSGDGVNLLVGSEGSSIEALTNTWSRGAPICGSVVLHASTAAADVLLEEGLCSAVTPLCGLDAPTFRGVPFRYALAPGFGGAGNCFATLAAALGAAAADSDVGILIAPGEHSIPTTALSIPGLVLEGEGGGAEPTLTALDATLLQVSAPTTVRGLKLKGEGASGTTLVEAIARTSVEDCTFETAGTALNVPAGGGTSVEVVSSRFSSSEALHALLDAGDQLLFLDNDVMTGRFLVLGTGDADIDGNNFAISFNDQIRLSSLGTVDFVRNTVTLQAAQTCQEGVSIEQGEVTLRSNTVGVAGAPLPCRAVGASDNNDLRADLGTVATPGGNAFFGDPDLFVQLDDPDSTLLVPAVGNTWSRPTPACGTNDASDDIHVSALSLATTRVEHASGTFCP